MEQTIVPKEILNKVSKANKIWWSIPCQDGVTYTCHEQAIVDQFEIGREVTVEVVVAGDWNNIRKLISIGQPVAEKVQEQKPEPLSSVKEEKFADSVKKRTARELTGFAKDLVVKIDTDDWEARMLKASKAIVATYKQVLSEL